MLDEVTKEALEGPVDGESITNDVMMQTNKKLGVFLQAVAFGAKVYADLQQTGPWILKGVVVAIIVAFMWIVLMQWFARYLVWVSILGLAGGLSLALYVSIGQYQHYSHPSPNYLLNTTPPAGVSMGGNLRLIDIDEVADSSPFKFYRSLSDDENLLEFDFKGMLLDQVKTIFENPTVWMVVCIVVGIFLLIVLLLMLTLCGKISQAVAVIEEAATAVNCMKSTLFFPLFPFILKIAAVGLFVFNVIVISTASHPQYRDQNLKLCIPLEQDVSSLY